MKLQRLLVALDGSPAAEATLAYVRLLAQVAGSSLWLVGVTQPMRGGIGGSRPSLTAAINGTHREDLRAYLGRVAARERAMELTVDTVLREGRPAEEILAAADDYGADLLCLATHGRGGLHRLRLGSVADEVLRASARPVLLVPTREEDGGQAPVALRHLLVPLDGSPLAEAALGPAGQLAELTGASVSLLQVAPYSTAIHGGYEFVPDFTVDRQMLVRAAEEYLHAIRKPLPEGLSVQAAAIRGPVAPALAEYARDNHVDLTVMTTHGRGGFRRLVLGSVADRLVRSGLPLLLLPAAAVEQDEEAAATRGLSSNG